MNAADVLLTGGEAGGRPAQSHRAVTPVFDAGTALTHGRVAVVDQIGRAQTPTQLRGEAQAIDREQFLQPFVQ